LNYPSEMPMLGAKGFSSTLSLKCWTRMKNAKIRTLPRLEQHRMTLIKKNFGLQDQEARCGILKLISILLCLSAALDGSATLAAQGVAPAEEKVFVPGNPVTNESVEAGLLNMRNILRSSPAFQKDDAPTHLRLAGVLSQQGDPNGAIEEYQAAIQLNPVFAEAYRGLGAVFIDTHEWKDAEDALRTSTRLDDTDSQTFYWLGRALMAQHKFPNATMAFITATDLNPQDAEAFSDLGLVRMAQGHASDAAKALTQAIHLKPDYAEAHHRLELLRASQQDPEQLTQAAFEILNILFRRE
jgi:cytochrome c-type biogenesis protein CcmH/NrfG